jgi:hypothetical protein
MNKIKYDIQDERIINYNVPKFCKPSNPHSALSKNSREFEVILGLHRFGAITNMLMHKGRMSPKDAYAYTLHSEVIDNIKISNLDDSIRGYTWYFETYLRCILEDIYNDKYTDLTLGGLIDQMYASGLLNSKQDDSLTFAILDFVREKRNEYQHGRYDRMRKYSDNLNDFFYVIMGFLRVSNAIFSTVLEFRFNQHKFSEKIVLSNVNIQSEKFDYSSVWVDAEIFNEDIFKIRNTLATIFPDFSTETICFISTIDFEIFKQDFCSNYYDLNHVIKVLVKSTGDEVNDVDFTIKLFSVSNLIKKSPILSSKNHVQTKINPTLRPNSVAVGRILYQFLSDRDMNKILDSVHSSRCLDLLDGGDITRDGIEEVGLYLNFIKDEPKNLRVVCRLYPYLLFHLTKDVLFSLEDYRLSLRRVLEGSNLDKEILITIGQTATDPYIHFHLLFKSALLEVYSQGQFRDFVDFLQEIPGTAHFLYLFSPLYSDLCFFDAKEENNLVYNRYGAKVDRVLYVAKIVRQNGELQSVLQSLKSKIESSHIFRSERINLEIFYRNIGNSHPYYSFEVKGANESSWLSYFEASLLFKAAGLLDLSSLKMSMAVKQFHPYSDLLALSVLALSKAKKARWTGEITFYSEKLNSHILIGDKNLYSNKIIVIVVQDEFNHLVLNSRNFNILYGKLRFENRFFSFLHATNIKQIDLFGQQSCEISEFSYSLESNPRIGFQVIQANEDLVNAFKNFLKAQSEALSNINIGEILDDDFDFNRRVYLVSNDGNDSLLLPVSVGRSESILNYDLGHGMLCYYGTDFIADLGLFVDYPELLENMKKQRIISELDIVWSFNEGNSGFARQSRRNQIQKRDYFLNDPLRRLKSGNRVIAVKTLNKMRTRQERYVLFETIDSEDRVGEFLKVIRKFEDYYLISLLYHSNEVNARLRIEDASHCEFIYGEKYLLFPSVIEFQFDAVRIKYGESLEKHI